MKWISLKERLPKDGQKVLLASDGFYATAIFHAESLGYKWAIQCYCVNHWDDTIEYWSRFKESPKVKK